MLGLKPHDMCVQVVVSPERSGILATMASVGVSCCLPPNGFSTEPAPMELSNISPSPFCEAVLRSDREALKPSSIDVFSAASVDAIDLPSGHSVAGDLTSI